jgi:hypothetical protein
MFARSLMLGVAAALVLAGCYSPSGGFIKRKKAAATYYSTPAYPATVTIVDTRTEEPFFTVEIPPGQELVIDFQEGKGDDDTLTPDLMIYELFELGTSTGRLRNSVTVPDSFSRRIDVEYREGPEAEPQSPDRPPRSDELADRPDWWTPEGGEKPDDRSTTLYDR